MRKNLSSFFIFLFILLAAQNAETIYLQKEHDRLSRLNNHETDIENYISQNIVAYELPSDLLNKLSTSKNEEGNILSSSGLDAAILTVKKQLLKEQYLSNNAAILNDYQVTAFPENQTCINSGFEELGSTAGFAFRSKQFVGQTFTAFSKRLSDLTPIAPPTNVVSTVNNSSPDPLTGLPRVKSGNYSLMLQNGNKSRAVISGDRADFATVSSMTKQFVVTDDYLTFSYALVLNDGINYHPYSYNPYYQCILRDVETNKEIFKREIYANANDAIFKVKVIPSMEYSTIVYTDWLCESIKTENYIGKEVRLELYVGDCGYGAHIGYAYFDDFCGTKCSAPTFGSVTLDPMGITCPLLPLTVSGNFITPAGYELANLTLTADNGNSVVYTSSPGDYNISGDEFSFKVTGPQLLLTQGTSTQFDFFVKAKFKLLGENSYFEVNSQSANVGADVTFNGSCIICNNCASPLTSYWFEGLWNAGDTIHHPEINSWVEYENKDGITVRKIIGPIENGCKKIDAIRIIKINQVSSCDQ